MLTGCLGDPKGRGARARVRVARHAPSARACRADSAAEFLGVADPKSRALQEGKDSRKARALALTREGLALLQAAAPVAVAAAAVASPGVAVACVPLPNLSTFAPTREEAEAQLRNCACVQGSVGVTLLILGDIPAGFVNCALATGGLYTASVSGSKFLPTFAFASFMNGSLQSLALSDILPAFHGDLFSSSAPALLNVAHVCVLAAPALSFAASFSAYTLVQVVRDEAHEVSAQIGRSSAERATVVRPEWVPFVGAAHRIGTPEGSEDGDGDASPAAKLKGSYL